MWKRPNLAGGMYKVTILLVFISLAACLPTAQITEKPPQTTQPAEPIPPATLPAQGTASPPPQPRLTIWLPPQWDPAQETPAAQLFRRRLDEFQSQLPNLSIEVRIKAMDGAGGMQESLISASSAAPMALPDLVALPRPLLESISQKGILHPLDSYVPAFDEDRWYPFAYQLALVQNTPYGIPFVGDIFVLAYQQSLQSEMSPRWSEWLESPYSLGFNANDEEALTLLSLYLSAGGKIQDEQGKPTLNQEILKAVLEDIAFAFRQGKIPIWTTQADGYQAVYQAFRERRIDSACLWSTTLLQENGGDWAIAPGFEIAGQSTAMANGWVWVSPSPIAEKIGLSYQMAAFLTEEQFLAEWSESAGYIPAQPGALSLWKNTPLAADLDEVAKSAELIPNKNLTSVVSPLLRNALLAVLKDHLPPEQAAAEAIAGLKKP